MPVVDILNTKAEKVAETELPDAIFNVEINNSVLHEVVNWQLAKKRSGSASVKRRSDVKGSQRKLFRQKGTGRARRGNIKSPLLRGGGVVFGPDPGSWAYKMPKKKRALAIKMALSCKLKENELIVLEKLELDEIRTKAAADVLKALTVSKALIVTDSRDEIVERSFRNIPGVKLLPKEGLNVYDILKYPKLLLIAGALEGIEGRLQ